MLCVSIFALFDLKQASKTKPILIPNENSSKNGETYFQPNIWKKMGMYMNLSFRVVALVSS